MATSESFEELKVSKKTDRACNISNTQEKVDTYDSSRNSNPIIVSEHGVLELNSFEAFNKGNHEELTIAFTR
jgi:hypothetical protein